MISVTKICFAVMIHQLEKHNVLRGIFLVMEQTNVLLHLPTVLATSTMTTREVIAQLESNQNKMVALSIAKAQKFA